MLWGKLIDHERCIGCHACSVACKAENDVPLGSFRTWVKQVEEPSGRRHFGVLRCNQCENAPCVAICPTKAMHRRPDGIVDFDADRCIGCKACILACPYDAIYIHPDHGTAAKCNFCAHRVEVNLEPACVSVCPTGALQVSDLEASDSPVAQALEQNELEVRKKELRTRPKVYYRGAHPDLLDPHRAERPALGSWGENRSVEAPPAEPAGGLGAPAASRVAYDVPREGEPWGYKIALYMLTKAIGSGAMIAGGVAALLLGAAAASPWPALVALVFLGLTGGLLIADLKRPERFYYLLTKGHWSSWLVKGAVVLTFAGAIATLWMLAWVLTESDLLWRTLGALSIGAGAAAAGYTAFLFGQALGRRFWQGPILLPHLVVQAGVAGAATMTWWIGPEERLLTTILLGGFLVLDLLLILAELWHSGEPDAELAARWLRGQRGWIFGFVIGAGHLLVGLLLLAGIPWLTSLAGLLAIAGVGCWDYFYVRAGQVPPLS